MYEILKFDEYKKAGGKGIYDKGVLSTILPEWREFYNEVGYFRNHKDYVWRGQRKGYQEWILQSKFDRRNIYKDMKERKKILEEHLNQFKKAIRGRRGANPPELKEDDLWALGQHNNLDTSLLDWTKSPFVASYFAFVKRGDGSKKDECKRVVYGLNRDIERWYQNTGGKKDYFIEFPDIEAHENARFLAQAGELTKALNGRDIKERVQKCYHETNHMDRIILVEIFIRDIDREECLRDLNRMNINHASLFPDIYGSAIFCNLKLEIDKYS